MIIRTPARIHITLLDLNGSYGRIDGGIGFSLQNPQFILESTQTESGVNVEFDDSITDEEAIEECNLKIKQAYEDICNHFDLDIGFNFKVHNAFSPSRRTVQPDRHERAAHHGTEAAAPGRGQPPRAS